jgi:hypothetical protein
MRLIYFLKEKSAALIRDSRRKAASIDRTLLVALALAFAFSLQGIDWGRVECWNPDALAFKSIHAHRYMKPPFDTYVTYIFAVLPAQGVRSVAGFFQLHGQKLPKKSFGELQLLLARLLVLAQFLGSVCVAFAIANGFFGLSAARCVALAFATSAGFVAYNHFLTADSPLLFWMLVAFYFSSRIVTSNRQRDYVLAGIFTGVATATKYNGLGVGIAIPVAHLLSLREFNVKTIALDRRLWLGLVCVLLGFAAASPYAILDCKIFVADFMYNYAVTPHYGGETGTGYLIFLKRMPEILGWPGCWMVIAALFLSAVAVVLRKKWDLFAKGLILCASVVVLYYAKMGAFARVETRFALPDAPFLLILAGAGLGLFVRIPLIGRPFFAAVILYNCVCSFYVGERFARDPRTASITWVQHNIPQRSKIETTGFCPKWDKHPGFDFEVNGMTVGTTRKELFGKIFAGNKWVIDRLDDVEQTVDEKQFTETALIARNPDFISVDSIGYLGSPSAKVIGFYKNLIAEKYPYKVVFDLETPKVSPWLYPQTIDFLNNRIVLLAKKKTS